MVCLIVWGFSSHSRIFHPYGDVTNTGEGLQILTIAQHSWSFRSAGSLACHTYREMRHSFMMVISEDHDTHTCCRAFNSGDALNFSFCIKTASVVLQLQEDVHQCSKLFTMFQVILCNLAKHLIFLFPWVFM